MVAIPGREQDDDIVSAVDLGGLCKRVGNPVKKVSHQQDVPGIAQRREKQHPYGVLEHQRLCNQQVAGHQAAVEQHGEIDEQRQHRAAFDAHGVGYRAGEQHGQKGSHNGDENGYDIGLGNVRAHHDQPIGVKGKFRGPQPIAVCRQRLLLCK